MRPQRRWWGSLFFVLAVLWQGAAVASPYVNLWHQIEAQMRGTQADTREIPLDVFQRLDVRELSKGWSLGGYAQYDHLFTQGEPDEDQCNLYNLQFQTTHLTKRLGMTLGRQTAVRNDYEGLLDGATFRFAASEKFHLDLFGGATSFVELGDFRGQHGLLAGSAAIWQPAPNTTFTLTSSYRRDNLTQKAWKTNDTVIVGIAGTQALGTSQDVLIYVDSAYDVAGRTATVGTVGLQWFASRKVALNVSGSRYDANRDRTRDTLLALYADDDLWQARFGLQYMPSHAVTLFSNYDWQQMEVGGRTRYGHVAEAGVDMELRKLRTEATLLYRFLDSFGGRAHDGLLVIDVTPWRFLGFETVANYTKYEKITNDNDTALMTGLTAVLMPTKVLTVRVGGEYLRNDFFQQEWRVLGQLTFDGDLHQ